MSYLLYFQHERSWNTGQWSSSLIKPNNNTSRPNIFLWCLISDSSMLCLSKHISIQMSIGKLLRSPTRSFWIYGHLTWEWEKGIRSYLHPMVFAFLYKVLAFSCLGTPWFMLLLDCCSPYSLQLVIIICTSYPRLYLVILLQDGQYPRRVFFFSFPHPYSLDCCIIIRFHAMDKVQSLMLLFMCIL